MWVRLAVCHRARVVRLQSIPRGSTWRAGAAAGGTVGSGHDSTGLRVLCSLSAFKLRRRKKKNRKGEKWGKKGEKKKKTTQIPNSKQNKSSYPRQNREKIAGDVGREAVYYSRGMRCQLQQLDNFPFSAHK